MAVRPVDVDRAARLLFEFRKRNSSALAGVDLALTVLDFKHDPAVDDLCRRLADDPALPLSAEPPEVRVLLSVRITLFIARAILEPERLAALRQLGPVDDRGAFAFLFGRVLARSRLPAGENGRLFSTEKPERLN